MRRPRVLSMVSLDNRHEPSRGVMPAPNKANTRKTRLSWEGVPALGTGDCSVRY